MDVLKRDNARSSARLDAVPIDPRLVDRKLGAGGQLLKGLTASCCQIRAETLVDKKQGGVRLSRLLENAERPIKEKPQAEFTLFVLVLEIANTCSKHAADGWG